MQSRTESLFYIVALCVIALGASYCGEADANPVTLRYRNPGVAGDPTYQEVIMRATGLPALPNAANCPPGMECLVVVPLQPGSYTIAVTARAAGLESAPSNSITKTIAPPVPCNFDYDRNGYLTGIDFGMWLADYEQGFWTAADFGIFMTRFGKTCAP